jgi:hypothetical protein
MRKFEAFIIGCILGAGPILFCLVAFFFIAKTAGFLTDTTGPYLALAALVTGLVIDMIFLGRWVRNAYRFNNKILAAIYIYYSVGALGMCMGVPLLNFGVGILGGIYTARRLYYTHAEHEVCKASIKKTAMFSAKVMMAMCCLTGTWALFGGMIGYRFESPMVSFTFTAPILIGIVLSGGLFLSAVQYWLTRATARLTMKMWK